MKLEEYLMSVAEQSGSYFQAHLAKEDLERVRRLKEKAIAADDVDALKHDALYLGWTPGDIRTGELKADIEPLIVAMHAHVNAVADAKLDEALLLAWKSFHEKRISVLIHCL